MRRSLLVLVLSISSAMLWRLFARTYSSASRSGIAGALAKSDVGLFVGTHTGVSLEYAKRLERELKWRLGVEAVLGSCDDFDFSTIDQVPASKTALFFITSYGVGEPTKNAVQMWDQLWRPHALNLEFSVLGRGSSAYGTFNQAAQDLDARLELLGARRIAPYAQTDRLAVDNEEPFFEWKENVISHLKQKHNLEEAPLVYIPSTDLKESPAGTTWEQTPRELLASLAINSPEKIAPEFAPFERKISRDSTGRTLVHAEFDLSHTSQVFETGDYLSVWPCNSAYETAQFLATFGLDAAQVVTVDNRWRSTYGQLAERFVDVNAQLGRETLKYFVGFAPTDAAAAALQRVIDDHDTFEQFSSTHFNIGRALAHCSEGAAWTVPPSLLLDVLPRLKPRDYSISSSPENDPTKVTIGLVVEGDNAESSAWHGVCSNFLLEATGPVAISTEMSDFKLPVAASTPIIMVGIGTGASPYRGFIEERQSLKDAGVEVGETVFFGGFRSEDAFQYRDFFEASAVVEVKAAYSRTASPQYVQHILEENGEQVYDLLNQGAHVYVCGSARLLGHRVRTTMVELIARNAGISFEAAKLQWKVMKRRGRVHQDMW